MAEASAQSGSARELLARNRDSFNRAARAALAASRSGALEQALRWARLAARSAWNEHPGFYTHPGIEEMLQQAGQSLEDSESELGAALGAQFPARRAGARTWLHLITTAYRVGGHTRLVERLIVNAGAGSADQHHVLIIDQGKNEVPDWLREVVGKTGGSLLVLPKKLGLVDRARLVRQIALHCADAVLLHVHPSDPVAPVAFARAGGPPVVYLNHADHVFWFGTRCCDLIAEIRPEGQQLTRSRRSDLPSLIVPIPLELPKMGLPAAEAKLGLGIGPDQVVLLSIASGYKFAPYGELDFPATAAELLCRNPQAVLLVVGPSETDPLWQQAVARCGGRLRLCGIQPDVARFYAAADICLESFPFGSLTSTLDAMLLAIPVLRAPQGALPLFAMTGYPGVAAPAPLDLYLQQATQYITDSEGRRAAGEAQREAVLQQHSGAGWHAAWERLAASLPESHLLRSQQSCAGWDIQEELDSVWAQVQQLQTPVQPFKRFKVRVRAAVRLQARGEALRVWLGAAVRLDWKLFGGLLRNFLKG
jgi:hypothetical protein